MGDDFRDRPGYGFARLVEGFVFGLTLLNKPSIEAFDNSVDCPQENATFSEDVGEVFALECRLEGAGGTECN